MSETTSSDLEQPALPARRSNRRITLLHRFEFALVVSLLAFFRVIGVDLASAIAGKFMRILGPMLRSISRRAETNLRHAFPEWDDAQIKKTTADVWENLGRTGAEYAHLDRLKITGAKPRIIECGFDKLQRQDSDFQQVIFVTGHFANWEAPALCAHQLGISFGVIYRAANNPLVDELVIRKRAETMTRYQTPKGRRGARTLVAYIKQGLSLAILVDQKLSDGISVPFMGRDAMTAPAAARMALKFDIPLIPISTERLGGAYFRVTAHDAIQHTPSGELKADIFALTKKINEALERDIKALPGQWLWLHRRWGKMADG
jgi:Kdo2-lipid IVA lauroyltransferase/acyltransferase